MATAGSIVVDLIARTGSFETDIQRASKGLKSFKDDMKVAATALASMTGALAGTAFAMFINETIQAEKEQAQLAAVLKSTGEAAGYSRKQLNDMASAMSSMSTLSAGEINQAQTTLLAFTGIVGEQFPQALQAAIDMSARTGMSVVQAAETIGRALDVPSQGLTSLSKQGFRFGDDQKKLAERLEATGKTAEAQAIILDALQESYGGAAEAARNTFGGSLTALKNTVADLLTGEDGSLEGLTGSINQLTDLLRSDEAKQAFGTFTSLIDDLGGMAATTMDELVDLYRVMQVVVQGSSAVIAMRQALGSMGAAMLPGTGVGAEDVARSVKKMEDAIQRSNAAMDDLMGGARHKYRNQWLERNGNPFDVPLDGSGIPMLSPNVVRPSSGGGKAKKGKVTDPLGDFMKGLNIDYAIDEYQKYLDFRDKVTGQALTKQRESEQQWLAGLLDMGDITKEQYTKTLAEMQGVHVDTMDEMGEFAKQAARNIQNALGDNLYSLLKGNFDDIGTAFSDMLLKMSADLAASQLSSALFGNFDKTGNIGGFLGDLLSGFRMGLGGPVNAGNVQLADTLRPMFGFEHALAFSGGGFTGFGGKYEPAGIVHRGEYVLNQEATKRIGVGVLDRMNRGYANGGLVGGSAPIKSDAGVVVNITNQGQPVTTAEQPRVTMDAMGRMVISFMIQDAQRNGPYVRTLKGVM